MAVSLH